MQHHLTLTIAKQMSIIKWFHKASVRPVLQMRNSQGVADGKAPAADCHSSLRWGVFCHGQPVDVWMSLLQQTDL